MYFIDGVWRSWYILKVPLSSIVWVFARRMMLRGCVLCIMQGIWWCVVWFFLVREVRDNAPLCIPYPQAPVHQPTYGHNSKRAGCIDWSHDVVCGDWLQPSPLCPHRLQTCHEVADNILHSDVPQQFVVFLKIMTFIKIWRAVGLKQDAKWSCNLHARMCLH